MEWLQQLHLGILGKKCLPRDTFEDLQPLQICRHPLPDTTVRLHHLETNEWNTLRWSWPNPPVQVPLRNRFPGAKTSLGGRTSYLLVDKLNQKVQSNTSRVNWREIQQVRDQTQKLRIKSAWSDDRQIFDSHQRILFWIILVNCRYLWVIKQVSTESAEMIKWPLIAATHWRNSRVAKKSLICIARYQLKSWVS